MTPPDTISLRAQAVAAVRWTTVWVALNKGLHVVSTIVLARALAQDQFGVIALLTLMTSAGMLVQEFGTSAGLIYRREDTDEVMGFALSFQLVVGLGLAGTTLLLASPAAAFFDNASLADPLRVLALLYLLNPLASVPLARLEKALDYRGKVLADLGGAVGQTATVIVLALLGWQIWSFVTGMLVGKATSVLLIWACWRPSVAFGFTARLARETLAYSRYVFGEMMLWFISVNVDDLIVGRLLGTAPLGVYKVGFSTAVMPATSVGALTRVAFPAFAKIRDDLVKLRRAFLRSTEYCLMVGTPAFVLAGVLAHPLVLVVYGERWLDAVPVLQILAPYSVLWLASTTVSDLFKAAGAVRALFWINVGRVALLIVSLLFAVRGGVVGVAIAVLAVAVLTRAAQFHVVSRLLRLATSDWVATFGPTLGAGAAMTVVVMAMRATLPSLPPVLDLIVHSTVGGVAYLVILGLVGRPRVVELVGLLRAAVAGRSA